jgi:hypothetical protein
MASPAIGGGKPIMPRQPGGRPELVVDPIIPGGGRPKRPRPPKLEKPRLKKPVVSPLVGFPGPRPYTPIKQTKAVGQVYKTY